MRFSSAFRFADWGRYGECLELIGEAEEEAKGGAIRATLLSNRATTLLKVRAFIQG